MVLIAHESCASATHAHEAIITDGFAPSSPPMSMATAAAPSAAPFDDNAQHAEGRRGLV